MSITGMTTKYCIVFQSTECPELCHESWFCVMGGRQRVPFLQRSSYPQIRLFSRQKALQRVGQDSLAPTEEVSVLNRPNSLKTVFSFARIKRPKNIPDPERSHLRSAEVTNTNTYRGHIQAPKCKGPSYLQRDPHDSR